jgi:tRNA (mo5U34)-methyltransferase
MSPSALKLSSQEVHRQLGEVAYWYHRIEVARGITTPGVHDSAAELRLLELPQDCGGLRALDIGARDGFFAFELEKRGAEVLAIDHISETQTGFAVAKNLLGSKVRFELTNVYDLSVERHGMFDIVLFLGILYHLRNPLLALDRVRSVCKDRMWLESHVIDHALLDTATGKTRDLKEVAPTLASTPIMQFFPRAELNQDFSNWWGPNIACLRALVAASNFSVQSEAQVGQRALLRCCIANDPQVSYFRDLEASVMQ